MSFDNALVLYNKIFIVHLHYILFTLTVDGTADLTTA